MNRLQELAGIKLNELQVNKPISKKEIIRFFLDNDELHLLYDLKDHQSAKEYMDYHGYESDDDFIVTNTLSFIEAYYKYFKPGEIDLTLVDDGTELDSHPLDKSYKFMTCYGTGDEATLVILHNEPFK